MKHKIVLLLGFSLIIAGCGKKNAIETSEAESSEVVYFTNGVEVDEETTHGQSPSRIYVFHDDDKLKSVSLETCDWNCRINSSVDQVSIGYLNNNYIEDEEGLVLGNKEGATFAVDDSTQLFIELFYGTKDVVAVGEPLYEDKSIAIWEKVESEYILYAYADIENQMYALIFTYDKEFNPVAFALDLYSRTTKN